MPLFKNQPATTTDEPATASSPPRKTSRFGRRRSLSPAEDSANDHANNTGRRGLFGRGSLDNGAANGNVNGTSNNNLARNGSVMSGGDSVRSGGGFFGRRAGNMDVHNDPTILAAREKVKSAEDAEADADRALVQARAMVREARDHVKFLEREAAAEARRAQQKQAMSNDVSKSAAGLGRHGN
ncbi:hypothetical protein DFH07DRAFT_790112 [Mycena maculata]|uniref:Uncharacterized protein n=1 Tax=Mycena maculata TaxID=230809 RepID=A0AAD7KFQ1_9AGAR|nr:hypothetical protein DFH07DRAFT_790112 [Mycena maculata]